jgi:hypothetical protein
MVNFDLFRQPEGRENTNFELLMRFELTTSSLPRKCSTPELQQQSKGYYLRAADEIRTRDIQLGRLTLYQLSYHRLFMLF